METIKNNIQMKKALTQAVKKINQDDPKLNHMDLLCTYQASYQYKKGESKDNIISQINKGKIGFMHPCFDNIRLQRAEQDDFIVNPFEVEEGVSQCTKCKSKKVFSYQKQVRSADEPFTTFNTCVNCGNKWSYSG